MKYKKLPIEIEAIEFKDDASGYDLLRWINEGQHKRG